MNYPKIKRGVYAHFKGRLYIVFSTAIDLDGNLYVFYRQNYGNKAFWIRPYENFMERVPDKQDAKRFSFKERIDADALYNELQKTLKESPFTIKHSETEKQYLIYSVPEDLTVPIKICPLNSNTCQSAYLTDFQIAQRMGYYVYSFKGKRNISTFPVQQDDSLRFEISSSDEPIQIIEEHLTNPCSIDLRIADDFFCKTTNKKIDLVSMLRYHTKSRDLWKEVKPKNNNGTPQLVLRPGETIITHTYEKISLPSDCAGKIEIKSTYARLSLSVTSSDFCNPGWAGYYPLVIHNWGKHKIILHPKEKMLQLMLIPTQAPIISEYSKNSTFMDDDGKPYRFWQSKAAKQFRKKHGLDEITDFYEKVLRTINTDNCDDVEGCKERFADTFLIFCEKELARNKYPYIKTKELWKNYKKSEQTKNRLANIRFGSLILALLPSIISIVYELIINKTISLSLSVIICSIASIIAIVFAVIWLTKFTKLFCTFEKLEYDKIISQKNKTA